MDTLKRKTINVLNVIMKWFQTKRLSVTIEKTNYMVYRSRNNNTNTDDFSLDINGTELQRVETFKFLGIWFD